MRLLILCFLLISALTMSGFVLTNDSADHWFFWSEIHRAKKLDLNPEVELRTNINNQIDNWESAGWRLTSNNPRPRVFRGSSFKLARVVKKELFQLKIIFNADSVRDRYSSMDCKIDVQNRDGDCGPYFELDDNIFLGEYSSDSRSWEIYFPANNDSIWAKKNEIINIPQGLTTELFEVIEPMSHVNAHVCDPRDTMCTD